MIRRLLTLLIALLCLGTANAQQNWGGGVDDEQLHFGFTFQYVSSEYKIFKRPDWRVPRYDPISNPASPTMVTDSLFSISSPSSPGFGLGFVTDYKLGNNANLRFTPALVFTDRLIDYNYAPSAGPESGTTENFTQKKVQATMIDFPLGIKLKSDRRKNFRAYMLAGAKYSLDIVSKKKLDDSSLSMSERLVKNTRSILWYEAGIGFDLYFEFFKLSPELKLSNSFRNVLKPEGHPYSAPIDKLFLRNLQFSLYFE
ncbi:MAG TPA: outer membrane beta-barrel protein [Sphingobacteriaceae bacterium]